MVLYRRDCNKNQKKHETSLQIRKNTILEILINLLSCNFFVKKKNRHMSILGTPYLISYPYLLYTEREREREAQQQAAAGARNRTPPHTEYMQSEYIIVHT